MSNQSENVHVPLEDEHDGDTAAEPTVKEIDNIYNWIIDVVRGDYIRDALQQDDDTEDKILQRMLLSLDRMSNSINRREEKDCEGEIDVEKIQSWMETH